jgi:hypothetical protein
LPDASLLNHSFSSGWLGSWASAGVQSSRKIRTIRIITVDRLPSFKGYASARPWHHFPNLVQRKHGHGPLVISGWGRAVTVQAT